MQSFLAQTLRYSIYKSPGKEMEWQWQICCQATETPTRLQNGIVWDNSGTNWQLQFCLSFVLFFLPFFLLPLCVVAFEDSQLRYQKRALLSYSLFSKCNLSLLRSHTQFFRIQKKIIIFYLVQDARMLVPAYKQTGTWTHAQNKRNQTASRRYQSENQCPSWIVWCYRLFSAWLGMALIF